MSSRFRYVVIILFSVSIAPASSGTDTKWTLNKAMTLLAGVKQLESTFVETKQSGFLKDDLVLSGTLRFTAPNTLEKHVLSPFDEIITIGHSQITIERQEGDSV